MNKIVSDVFVNNYEYFLSSAIFLAALSFYMLHFLRAKIKYTMFENEKKQRNLIVLCKTAGFMMIFIAALFVIFMFTL